MNYKSILILFIITLVGGGALGVINSLAAEPIRIQEEKALRESMQAIFPDADEFIPIDGLEVDWVRSCYRADSGGAVTGYVIETAAKGYGGNVVVLTGINTDGAIEGVQIADHSETPGLGANADKAEFTNQYIGKSGIVSVVKMSPGDSDIEAITSATITSNAVTASVNDALEFYNARLKEAH